MLTGVGAVDLPAERQMVSGYSNADNRRLNVKELLHWDSCVF